MTDDGRLAGSVSGGCVEGAAAEEIWASRKTGRERVIRYGISDEQAWDVGPRVRRDDRRAGLARGPGGRRSWPRARRATGGATAGRSSRRSPRTRRRPSSGAHAPGQGSEPATPLVVHDDGRLDGTLGDAGPDAALVEAGREALAQGVSRTVEVGGRQLFLEAYPVRPRLVVVGAVEVARTLVRLAKELGYETVVIDGRAAFATDGAVPGRGPARGRLAGRGGRRDRPGPGRRRGGPDP